MWTASFLQVIDDLDFFPVDAVTGLKSCFSSLDLICCFVANYRVVSLVPKAFIHFYAPHYLEKTPGKHVCYRHLIKLNLGLFDHFLHCNFNSPVLSVWTILQKKFKINQQKSSQFYLLFSLHLRFYWCKLYVFLNCLMFLLCLMLSTLKCIVVKRCRTNYICLAFIQSVTSE